jgi:hypothetical protein
MPDLSPDMSVYSRLQPPPGVGNMSLGDLIGLAQRTREYNTQTSLSDALKGATDPNDPNNIDYAKAQQSFVQDPRSIVTPQALQSVTSANSAQFGLNIQRAGVANDAVTSLLGKENPTADDVRDLAARVSRYDPSMIPFMTRMTANIPSDPASIKKYVVDTWNFAHPGQAIPAVERPNASGGTSYTPAPAQNVRDYGVGGSANPMQQAGGVGGQSLPAGAKEAQVAYAGEGVEMRDGAPALQNTKAMLDRLNALNQDASRPSGPSADFQVHASQFAHDFGYNGPMDAKTLANAEEYKKIAETLVGQMASGRHTTDAYLNNAYGSNPNLNLSKLGAAGITHWLQGNVDAQSFLQSQWSNWLSDHPGHEQDYPNWLNGKVPGGLAGGIKNFDPRVFQFERMAPEEQAEFVKQLRGNGVGALARFRDNVNRYRQNGWTGQTIGP